MIADAATHRVVVTCEDGIRDGGIGMTIADRSTDRPGVGVEVLGLPGRFIPQGKPDRILAQLGLDADGIAANGPPSSRDNHPGLSCAGSRR
jgi:1-deoxy-D-xylulose-5-phosphate synthase